MPTWKESLTVDVIAQMRNSTGCDNWEVDITEDNIMFVRGTVTHENPVVGGGTVFLSIGLDLKGFLQAENTLVISDWAIAALIDGVKGMMPKSFFVRVESANLRLQ